MLLRPTQRRPEEIFRDELLHPRVARVEEHAIEVLLRGVQHTTMGPALLQALRHARDELGSLRVLLEPAHLISAVKTMQDVWHLRNLLGFGLLDL